MHSSCVENKRCGRENCDACGERAREIIAAARAGHPIAEAVITSPRAPHATPLLCSFLGKPTGAVAECRTCSGTARLKVFECSQFGTATIARKADGVPGCCAGGKCPEYKASE